ncbi:type VI secretion system-associated FHA domain protein [Oceanospirillum beijerinckii]|uniref:type VI secretion system-associated FHA domain protein n=1 Tax=Oceanospirillum beijerinckii TaxID=64976 RepID=UPI000418A688|nr:FHA domain-containing protein [Oceanospirillum beijerinckii]
MSISIQLVETPENEQVGSRQLSLPDAGGTIGRSYDCNIQLPDFQRQLSRIHAEISRDDKGQYYVTDRSMNGLFVNNRCLGNGQRQAINDGDLLRLGDYVLLVSDMQSLFSIPKEAAPWDDDQPEAVRSEPVFSMDDLKKEEQQWGNRYDDDEVIIADNEPLSTFSHDKVMQDDHVGYDPFDDDYELEMTGADLNSGPSLTGGPSGRPSSGQVSPRSLTLESGADLQADQQLIRDSLSQLNQLIDKQRQVQSEQYSHDRLMDCIERALSRFLEELDPAGQEEMFRDYISGWGNKDKKYWRLYRKQFSQKLQRKEYHRQFAALFIEELRGKGQ